MKNKMTNTSPKRSFTRAVAGTTFCTIGTLTDIIEMAEKIRAIAKQNPKTKAPEKRQPSLEEQAKERRYLFSVAFTRFEDALQTDVPTCAEGAFAPRHRSLWAHRNRQDASRVVDLFHPEG